MLPRESAAPALKLRTQGEVKYEAEPSALTAEEKKAGYILTCIACPVERVVIKA
jgi:ferredoxin